MNPLAQVLLLAALALGGCAFREASVREATAYIQTPFGGGCSATYIAPRLLLTASHCFPVESGPLVINGKRGNIVSIRHDGADMAVVVVDIESKTWARIGKAPAQGDVLFFYGNPSDFNGLLRRGYVVGLYGDRTLVDMTIGRGDSGAGVFNEKGELIGVVSQIYSAPPTFHIGAVRAIPEGFL